METGKFILYNTLKAIFLHIDNHEKVLFNQFDLSVVRFYALMHIHNHPRINYIELSNLLLCTKGNTTRIVASLQADGFVEPVGSQSDGRAFELTLSDKGEALYQRVHSAYLQQIDQMMSHFDDNELARYSEMSGLIERKLAPVDSLAGGI